MLVLPASSDAFDEKIAARKVVQLIIQALKQTGQCGDAAQRQVHSHFAGLEVITSRSDDSNATQAEALGRRLYCVLFRTVNLGGCILK